MHVLIVNYTVTLYMHLYEFYSTLKTIYRNNISLFDAFSCVVGVSFRVHIDGSKNDADEAQPTSVIR